MPKELSSLPKFILNVNNILNRADGMDGIVTFESSIKGMGYALDLESLLILTRANGYILINNQDLQALAKDLQWLREEAERRNRD